MSRNSKVLVTFAAVAATAGAASLVPGAMTASTATANTGYAESMEHLELENSQLRADLRSYELAANTLMDGLDRIDSAAGKLKDRRSQRTITNVVDDIRADVGDFVIDTGAYDDGYGGSGGGYYGTYAYTATDADITALTDHMASKNFAEDQLSAVKTASDRTWFTSAQVLTLMKASKFEDTRIDIAAYLYPQVVDPQNWYQVEDGLKFSSSKHTLRTRLAQ